MAVEILFFGTGCTAQNGAKIQTASNFGGEEIMRRATPSCIRFRCADSMCRFDVQIRCADSMCRFDVQIQCAFLNAFENGNYTKIIIKKTIFSFMREETEILNIKVPLSQRAGSESCGHRNVESAPESRRQEWGKKPAWQADVWSHQRRLCGC
jgi:hypothetical protein